MRTSFHKCIGVCGEPCLQFCRFCDEEKYNNDIAATFFGTEDEEGAMFMKLPDCPNHCIVEVHGIDSWVDTKMGETMPENSSKEVVASLECPKCKTPIKTCRRYAQELKQQFCDVSQLKRILLGNSKELIRYFVILFEIWKNIYSISSKISRPSKIRTPLKK